MTDSTEALDRLAPIREWEADWDDVLRRAGEAAPTPSVRRRAPRRRIVLLVAVLVTIVAPLTALAAVNHWWFLRAGSGLPGPGRRPTVVARGTWSGHPWTLVAYPSKHFAGTT